MGGRTRLRYLTKERRNLSGLYPTTAFHAASETMYWSPSPSRFSSGHMLPDRRISGLRTAGATESAPEDADVVEQDGPLPVEAAKSGLSAAHEHRERHERK